MAVYIKNNTDNFAVQIPSIYGNKTLSFPKGETAEVSDDDFDFLKKNNGLFAKFLNQNRITKVGKPKVKRIEDLEVKTKSLEIEVKEEKKKTAEAEKKAQDLEKEIISLKEQLNKKAVKTS